MMVNNVVVEEGYIEVFPFYFAKFIVTALSSEWALTAARTINHAPFSTIIEKIETNQEISELDYYLGPRIGIDKHLEHTDTPDYRPGISIFIGGNNTETTKSEMLRRLYVLTCPTISIFDGFHMADESETIISVQELIQIISGNTAIKAKMGSRIIFSIPNQEGEACRIDPEFKVRKGFVGAHILICGTSQKDTLKATMSAVDTIQEFDNVFCPYPAGINRLGSIFGSTHYYPTLADKNTESKVPKGVKCIYELEINGLSLESIKKAIKAGIQEACQVKEIKRILTREPIGKPDGKKLRIKEILE